MRHDVRRPALLVLLTASTLASVGCETDQGVTCGTSQLSADDSQATRLPTHQFYYYPTTQVYRDCQVDRWFWPSEGAWKQGKTLPAAFEPGTEIPFVIELTSADPTAQHASIAREYPGSGLGETNANAIGTEN